MDNLSNDQHPPPEQDICYSGWTQWQIVTKPTVSIRVHSWWCTFCGFGQTYPSLWASQVAQWQRICLPIQEIQEIQVWSLGWEELLEKEMAAYSSIIAWRIPWQRSLGATVHGVAESDRTEPSENTHTCIITLQHSVFTALKILCAPPVYLSIPANPWQLLIFLLSP